MSLTARLDKAAQVLDKLKEHLKQEVHFDRDSTAFDMGVQEERRTLLYKIKHWENT